MASSSVFPYNLFKLPTGEAIWIPADVELRLPEKTTVQPSLLHYLITIPWDDKYMELVDPAYRDFFRAVLPTLHVRTSDVHTATCLPFVKELIRLEHEPMDEQVVVLAFILHDSGWSQMTEQEIVDSLSVEGLVLSGAALSRKARHAELGKEMAQRILGEYTFQPPLTSRQKELIYQAILYHDKPQQLATMGNVPAEVQIVCDADHLWSFTHANFWQDTVRKGVNPHTYLKNLENDLDGYFVAEAGKRKARQMVELRAAEERSWEEWVAQH